MRKWSIVSVVTCVIAIAIILPRAPDAKAMPASDVSARLGPTSEAALEQSASDQGDDQAGPEKRCRKADVRCKEDSQCCSGRCECLWSQSNGRNIGACCDN
jgi:hypothetical protein